MKKRIEEIDIIKAIAIIFMVAGHSGVEYSFVALFHMAVFFIASGFFVKETSSDSIKNVLDYVIKKIKKLWLPYFIWNSMFILLNNFFIFINVYTDNSNLLTFGFATNNTIHHYLSIKEIIVGIIKTFFFYSDTELGRAFWFVKVLFGVSILFCLFDYLLKRFITKYRFICQIVISLVLLSVGYYLSVRHVDFLGIGRLCSCYCLYFFGNVLATVQKLYINWNWKHMIFVLLLSTGILFILRATGSVSIGTNEYPNPLFLLLSSLSGWCFLYSVSFFIKHTIIKPIFLILGKHTLIIVALHFLSFKIFAFFVCLIYNLPYYCIATFPNLLGSENFLWVGYCFVGVLIPVLFELMYQRVFVLLKRKRKNSVE